jgi:hypothetical protein
VSKKLDKFVVANGSPCVGVRPLVKANLCSPKLYLPVRVAGAGFMMSNTVMLCEFSSWFLVVSVAHIVALYASVLCCPVCSSFGLNPVVELK